MNQLELENSFLRKRASELQSEAQKASGEVRRVKSILFDLLHPDMAEKTEAELKTRILDQEHTITQLTKECDRLRTSNQKLKTQLATIEERTL